jgi:hypothetical protein
MRKNDYAEISRLNDRLKRTIPIIPAAFGISGATLGEGVDQGGFPGFFGFPGFPGFGPPTGPTGPQGPQGPTGPQSTETTIEESTQTETNNTTEQTSPIKIPVEPYVPPTTPGTGKPEETEQPGVPEPSQPPVPVPPKRKDDEPDVEEEEEEKKPIPLPDPPPTPIPLTPPFPIPRRKKEKEEEKELVPTAMSLYEFELALRSRRQQEKGADPAWLAPYFAYLAEFFRRNKAARGTREGFLNPGKYPLGGAVELPDGGILTVNPVGNPFDRQPSFRYVNGINRRKGDKNAKQALAIMDLVQAVMNVLGPFAAATAARPGQTTPRQPSTVPDPNYVPPASTGPLIPPRPPGSVIQPTKPDGGPLGRPQTTPVRPQKLLPQGSQGQTIDVSPIQRSTSQSAGQTTIFGQGGRKVQKSLPGSVKSSMAEYNKETLINLLRNAYKDNINRIRKTPTQNELDIKDALRQKGIEPPTPAELGVGLGPQASARTLIKPIYILTDQIA